MRNDPYYAPGGGLSRSDAVYVVFTALFAVVLVLTNLIGVKLFALFPDGRPSWLPGSGPVTLTSGIITYPLTFLLTDITSEIWGRRKADFMVIIGFGMSLTMLAIVVMARALPPSPYWEITQLGMKFEALETAFDATFYFPGLLLFASMLAYLVAQLLDVRLYHFWWGFTGGKHLWLRNNGSTILSQLVDTLIVNGIYLRFGLHFGWATIGEIIVSVYVCKVILALCDTPFMYLSRSLLRAFLALPPDHAPEHAPLL